MLGHKMFQRLGQRIPETFCTLRGEIPAVPSLIFRSANVIEHLDVTDFATLTALLSDYRPKVVVNCAGIIKQRAESQDAVASIAVNSLLPHKLCQVCRSWGGRLIQFSTDCVFSGAKGPYSEEDVPDAIDLYGRTKALGEVISDNALTLRTSIIGRELFHHSSLLEWFLAQEGKSVHGYERALWSGVTTNYLSDLVGDVIEDFPRLSGLYQVAGDPISKYELLQVLREAYQLPVEILPDHEFACDRRMNGNKFQKATGRRCPSWTDLVAQLIKDDEPYGKWQTEKQQAL